MSTLPKPPHEVPAIHDVAVLAPKFREALERVLMKMVAKGWQPVVLETQRSEERAVFLYGFGRQYDDGRGKVTNVSTAKRGWHFFCLAADLGDRRWDAEHTPMRFYRDLDEIAEDEGCTSGRDWNRNDKADEHFCDNPHVQWFWPGMNVSPSAHAAELYEHGGAEAVWKALHAA